LNAWKEESSRTKKEWNAARKSCHAAIAVNEPEVMKEHLKKSRGTEAWTIPLGTDGPSSLLNTK
jgi:hypothetical protein